VKTQPRPKCQLQVSWDLNPGFQINPDLDPDPDGSRCLQIAPKMWIYCLISISRFAGFFKIGVDCVRNGKKSKIPHSAVVDKMTK